MPDEDEALAQTLYAIYYEALGNDRWAWQELTDEERTAWIMVAQWVISNRDNEPDHK